MRVAGLKNAVVCVVVHPGDYAVARGLFPPQSPRLRPVRYSKYTAKGPRTHAHMHVTKTRLGLISSNHEEELGKKRGKEMTKVWGKRSGGRKRALAAIVLVTPTLIPSLSLSLFFNQVLNTSIVAHLESIPTTFRDIGRNFLASPPTFYSFSDRIFLLIGSNAFRVIAIVSDVCKIVERKWYKRPKILKSRTSGPE